MKRVINFFVLIWSFIITPKSVDHPSHYEAEGIEVIDIIESFGLGFHLGNAVKYILRAGRKTDNPAEDIQKAIWYLNRYIDSPRTSNCVIYDDPTTS